MPLPEEVINRLSNERPPAIGWSSSLLWFAAGLFAITLVLYAGIAFAYKPYVDGRIAAVTSQLAVASKSIDPNQEAALISFYSELVHVKSLLASRTVFSPALTWLSRDTQANTYYAAMSFSSGNQIVLTALARTEADLNQQIAIFESDPNVEAVNISNISLASVSGYLQANITLTLKPALLTAGQ
jgi:hypothetical protein